MNYKNMTDDQLIQELRNGTSDITDFLMEKYKGLVKRKARAMYLWGGEREDLIQEGMIGLFKAINDYKPEEDSSFSGFAELCVSRQMYTAIKASQRKKHIPLNSYVSLYTEHEVGEDGYVLPLAETIEASNESNPEIQVLAAEHAESFEEELRKRLSKLENRVLYLQMNGMDYQTIAKIMDKSPKTVDNALQRMKTKARQLLEEKIHSE